MADADYAAAGATVGSLADVLKYADIILGVQGPSVDSLSGFRPGALLVASLNPFGERARVETYAAAGLQALAMEPMPRITRAQSMDILSSHSNLSGYKAVRVSARSEERRVGKGWGRLCESRGWPET